VNLNPHPDPHPHQDFFLDPHPHFFDADPQHCPIHITSKIFFSKWALSLKTPAAIVKIKIISIHLYMNAKENFNNF
jgi:hypothetical protein